MAVFILSYGCLEQLNSKILEGHYDELGVENVFKVWWVYHGVEKVMMFFVKNLIIIFDAKMNFPEFNGYFGAVYPGSEKPRPLNPYQAPVTRQRRIRTSGFIQVKEKAQHPAPSTLQAQLHNPYLLEFAKESSAVP